MKNSCCRVLPKFSHIKPLVFTLNFHFKFAFRDSQVSLCIHESMAQACSAGAQPGRWVGSQETAMHLWPLSCTNQLSMCRSPVCIWDWGIWGANIFPPQVWIWPLWEAGSVRFQAGVSFFFKIFYGQLGLEMNFWTFCKEVKEHRVTAASSTGVSFLCREVNTYRFPFLVRLVTPPAKLL